MGPAEDVPGGTEPRTHAHEHDQLRLGPDCYLTQPLPAARAGAALEELTGRQREVVALAAHDLANDQTADRIVTRPMTAKAHINRAMTKPHARDRAQRVVLAYESGLAGTGARRRQSQPDTVPLAAVPARGGTRTARGMLAVDVGATAVLRSPGVTCWSGAAAPSHVRS